MIKPVLKKSFTQDGFYIRTPRIMRLGRNLTASFNTNSQVILLKRGKTVLGQASVSIKKGTIKNVCFENKSTVIPFEKNYKILNDYMFIPAV